MSSKVQTLAPTDGIKDPQVRAFCDSLANAWQLRNGNTGFDDKERFITKQEWDYLAKNPNIRAIAGVGQEGAMINEPGAPGTGTAPVGAGGAFVIPPWIQNLIDFLSSGITLIDFNEFKQSQGDLWQTIYRLTSQTGDSTAGLSLEITARTASDMALATQLNKLWAEVGNANPANALVLMGATVSVNPIAGTAVIFDSVQAAVSDANGNVYQAAGKAEFTAYVNADTAIANASYSLIVQAAANGRTAITGMSLTAQVVPGQPPQSAIVMFADNFLITNKVGAPLTETPFIVSGGKVRINLLYIGDYIRSDIFFEPGFGGYRDGFGWAINKSGDAQFYGLVTLAKVLSGSVLIDHDSKQPMATIATCAWFGALTSGTQTQTDASKLRFYFPGNHTSGSATIYNRVRKSSSAEGGNGVDLPTVVSFSGQADHWVTIWRRYNGTGPWEPLNVITAAGSGYAQINCEWVGTTRTGAGGYVEFGVSPTNAANVPGDPSKIDLRDFALTVTMGSI